VVCTRTADLIRSQTYDITGDAILELFDDNTVKLRLSSDFTTSRGPDVQIFLSTDSMDITDAVPLVDIGSSDGLNHFSGALDIDVPTEVMIDEYDHIVFRCFAFRVHWAHGNFDVRCNGDSDTTMMNMDTAMTCVETIAATTNWVTEASVCAVDGTADIIPLANTQMIPAGDEYAYVFTDKEKKIRFIHLEDEYDFEGSGPQTDYIYGVSYSGDLNYEVGDDLLSITASGCAIVSDTATFLTVTKEDCGEVYECLPTNTATTRWVTERHICPNDGVADEIELLNNEFIAPGEHYAFVITDTNNVIRTLHFEGTYDFEGSGDEPDRVFGVSFDNNIDFTTGGPLSSINSDGCTILSDTTIFLTVYKDSCAMSSFECIATSVNIMGGATEISVCETDGEDDIINLNNSEGETAGTNYTYIITDDEDKVKFTDETGAYNFDNSGSQTFRVYGLSHDGAVTADVASDINDVTAEGCFQLSSNFITITKGDCATDTTTNEGTITISGTVNNVKGNPLNNIVVKLDDDTSVMTDSDGNYSFSDVSTNEAHVITASFDGPLLSGVTSSDIVAGQRHILQLSVIENKYNLEAADINNNGTITASDLILIQNVLLGKRDSFGNAGSWKFLEDKNDDARPAAQIDIPAGSSDMSNLNFIGVKTGDINGNANQ